MAKKFLTLLFISLSSLSTANAQMFDGWEDWEDGENTIIIGKWSQLFYELNVGYNVSAGEEYADFLYFALGVGYPVNNKRTNAWRKFLPSQKIPDNEEEAAMFGSMNTDDVYGGKLGLGWIHYFNHAIGFYAQASWGFLADFGSPDDTTTSTSSDSNSKKTFIYNTVPVELGVCVNMWHHVHLQGGVTYMWKEVPLLTVGLGFNF